MSVPRRVQRRRGRGWRMPDGAIYVGRPTAWGNPFRVTRSSDYHGLDGSWFVLDEDGATYHPEHDTERSARQRAVELFAHTVSDRPDGPLTGQRIQDELRGHDLVCWCPIAEPCHADVLLDLANDVTPSAAPLLPSVDEIGGPPPTSPRRRSTRP